MLCSLYHIFILPIYVYHDFYWFIIFWKFQCSISTISDPAAHLGLTSGTDSHWGSYNSSYASYLGQTQPASFNSTAAAISAYGSAVGGANTAGGEVGSASTGTASSGHLLTDHASTTNQIPTGKKPC